MRNPTNDRTSVQSCSPACRLPCPVVVLDHQLYDTSGPPTGSGLRKHTCVRPKNQVGMLSLAPGDRCMPVSSVEANADPAAEAINAPLRLAIASSRRARPDLVFVIIFVTFRSVN